MTKYLFFLCFIFLIGCNTTQKEDYTYFGGKIINPKSKFVVISDNEGVIDSIQLQQDNTFLGKLTNIKTGLYVFRHGPELQYVFLESKDSLLIRLNTWDFDESLVFSGINADRNNALIDAFLQSEKDEKQFYSFFKLPYKEFKRKIDSTKNVKHIFFENYKTQNEETSNAFLSLLKVAIMYPVYQKIESYSMYNSKRKKPQKLDSLTLYSYRDKINLKLDSLLFFPPYYNLVINQIYNDTHKRTGLQDFSDEFNAELLRCINEKIESDKAKSKLLRHSTIWHFYRKSSCTIDTKTFDTFFSLSTNEEDKKEVQLLLNDAKSARKNDKLPHFTLVSSEGKLEQSLNLTRNKNAVLYFRNTEYSSDEWVVSRINYLIKKYPKINFYVININEDNKNYIEKLATKNQYYLNKDSEAHSFLTSKFSRMILVNKNGTIENGFGGLSSQIVDTQIASLEKK